MGNSLDYKHQGFFHRGNTILGINKTEALGNCSPTSSTAYTQTETSTFGLQSGGLLEYINTYIMSREHNQKRKA